MIDQDSDSGLETPLHPDGSSFSGNSEVHLLDSNIYLRATDSMKSFPSELVDYENLWNEDSTLLILRKPFLLDGKGSSKITREL